MRIRSLTVAALSAAALLAVAMPGAALTISQVQTTALSSVTAISTTVTFSPAPAAGDVLMVFVATGSTTAPVSTVTGGAASYSQLAHSAVQRNVEIWCGVAASGSVVTVTLTASTSIIASAVEFHNATCTVDGSFAAANSASNSTVTTGTVTTANASDLVVGGAKTVGQPITNAPTGGYTGVNCGGGLTACGAYLLNATAGSQSTTWVLGAAAAWDAVLVAVRAAGAPPSGMVILW